MNPDPGIRFGGFLDPGLVVNLRMMVMRSSGADRTRQ